jgi:hypothetical protein
MLALLFSVVVSIRSRVRSPAALQVEILALRHPVTVLKRSQRGRVRLDPADRLLWVWLSRLWSPWRSRTHRALGKDPRVSRPVQPPMLGPIVELPEVGGLPSPVRAGRGVRACSRTEKGVAPPGLDPVPQRLCAGGNRSVSDSAASSSMEHVSIQQLSRSFDAPLNNPIFAAD